MCESWPATFGRRRPCTRSLAWGEPRWIDSRTCAGADSFDATPLISLIGLPRRWRRHLFYAGRTFVFPCDAKGRVDLDSLSPRARNNYFFARALVGREVIAPTVVCRELDAARVR